MKKTYLFIIAALLVTSSFAQNKTPYMVKKFPVAGIKSLEVSTSGGGINVMGKAANEAEVKVFVSGNNSKNELSAKEIEKLLENYILEIAKEGDLLRCTAKNKGQMDWKKSLSISFEIKVPEKINTNLKTSGGSISLEKLTGKLDFSTSGGSLSLTNLSGNINGRTSGGSIGLTDSDGEIDLKTSGGAIAANNSKGNINLATSGGSFDLKNLKGQIMARTSGGGIDAEMIEGSLIVSTSGGAIDLKAISGDVIATTSGGGINADIKKLGKKLKLSTSAGSIHANLPFDAGMDLDIKGSKIKSDKLAKVSNKLETGRVKGKINGGGTEVIISSSVGTVYLD
jgi:hypothetical protein